MTLKVILNFSSTSCEHRPTKGPNLFFSPGLPTNLNFLTRSLFSYVLKFRVRSQQLSTVGLTALTYSDELNQGAVDVGSLRQEEAAPRTQVMEEEQVLLLI